MSSSIGEAIGTGVGLGVGLGVVGMMLGGVKDLTRIKIPLKKINGYIIIVKDNEKGVVKPWRVQIHEGGSMFYTSWRGFKTKSEALAYAKYYLKKK